jgi:hypothetical protein
MVAATTAPILIISRSRHAPVGKAITVPAEGGRMGRGSSSLLKNSEWM